MKWRKAIFQKNYSDMIQDLRKRMKAKIEKMQETFTKDQEELKNKQIEVNNTLDGINSRITEVEKPQVK